MRFRSEEALRRPAEARFHLGLAYVPEERRTVPGLAVRENLRLGLITARGRRDEARPWTASPKPSPACASAWTSRPPPCPGREQMLAIARTLMAEPRLLMLDEPSEGIMPVLVDEMFDHLFARLRRDGTTLLRVE